MAQKECSRGKKRDHTGHNVLLGHALLRSLCLSDTEGGRVPDKPLAAATSAPLPAGSRLVQELGFLACTRPQMAILLPTPPRGQERTVAQQRANQALHHRRLRIEQVNSSGKRWRLGQDRIRLWKDGIRDLVLELGWPLHTFRVRLTPWPPMV